MLVSRESSEERRKKASESLVAVGELMMREQMEADETFGRGE